MSVEWTMKMRDAWETHDLAEFERLLDQNYVTRWGRVRISVSREIPFSLAQKYIFLEARDRAKLMGGVVEDIDDFTVERSTDGFDDNVYTWKVRRD